MQSYKRVVKLESWRGLQVEFDVTCEHTRSATAAVLAYTPYAWDRPPLPDHRHAYAAINFATEPAAAFTFGMLSCHMQ